MGCRSVPRPAGEVDRGVPACCGHAPGRRPPQMRSVHLISGQESAALRACLLRTASTFPAPGIRGIQCSARLRSMGCSSPRRGNTRHMFDGGHSEARMACAGLERSGRYRSPGRTVGNPTSKYRKTTLGRCLPHSLIGSQPGLAKPPSLPQRVQLGK